MGGGEEEEFFFMYTFTPIPTPAPIYFMDDPLPFTSCRHCAKWVIMTVFGILFLHTGHRRCTVMLLHDTSTSTCYTHTHTHTTHTTPLIKV